MVPGIATTVGVDLLVPCGDAIGVAPATSMVGQAACCVVKYVVVVFVELRFIVGRRQPRWLWERVVGSHGVVVIKVRQQWQEGFMDGKSLTERSARLAGAGVNYAYGRRLPHWGVTMEVLLLCGLLAWWSCTSSWSMCV
jgi:hypothetical protein